MPQRKASKSGSKNRIEPEPETRLLSWLSAGGIAIAWILTASILASRVHLVMGYATLPAGPPDSEPFLSSNSAFGFACLLSLVWWLLIIRISSNETFALRMAVLLLSVALLPLALWIGRLLSITLPAPLYWEPVWFAFWTGMSFSVLTAFQPSIAMAIRLQSWAGSLPVVLCASSAVWWYSQTAWYYAHYQLGFNDFGQFTLRIANTAAGRGLLLESPVLPTYWDHFNPSLLALVPLWKLFPSAHLIFWLQAICLSTSGWLVWRIAIKLRFSKLAAVLWSAAWLAQPAIGQMNLAYTYGWHPISMAIPLLLASLLCLLSGKKRLAIVTVCGAMLTEESVIAVVCIFSLSNSLLNSWENFREATPGPIPDKGVRTLFSRSFLSWWWNSLWGRQNGNVSSLTLGLNSRQWLACGALAALGFVCVYRFSGIAEFQTGRFVALGDNAFEVILSPVLNPRAFWGQLFQLTKLAYVLSLTIPCFLVSLLRGWRWLGAACVPLGLLLVWDHRPASCLAFQYPSSFLPVLWLATMSGAARLNKTQPAAGALVTGLVLSLFVGQLPYSCNSLADVITRSYGVEITSRGPTTDLGNWLDKRIQEVSQDKGEVLATGRIAAHFLGNRDVETVQQYLERRSQLSELDDRAGQPILYYRWIILDRAEAMQQGRLETESTETEARQSGFTVHAENDTIVVFKHP